MSAALRQLVSASVAPRTVRGRPSQRWSGASIVGGKISIVSVRKDGKGAWTVDELRSREFDLTQRDQASAWRLHSTLNGFFRRSMISRIFLRTGSSRGPHAAKVETGICEGLLSVAGGVAVEQVSAFSLAPWMRLRGYDLEGQGRNRGWQYATAAAIYAAEHHEKRRAAKRLAG